MRLSRSERIFFVAIIITVTMGMLLLVLSTMFFAQNIIRPAWAPNTVRIVREAVMGEPSTTVGEVQKIIRFREDVPLPETKAMFDAGFRAEPDGFSFRNYGTRYPDGTGVRQAPDGTVVQRIQVDGTVQEQPEGTIASVGPDSTVTYEYLDGRVETMYPDGIVETVQVDGIVIRHLPDGAVQTIQPDGTVETVGPDGTQTVAYPSGVVWEETADGMVILAYPGGTIVR